MNNALWISFIGTVSLLALTPGPSVLLVVANSLKHGPKKTIGTILGDLSANLIQITLASIGIASIIHASGMLFQVMKWLGVCYLIYMGVKRITLNKSTADINTQKAKGSFLKLYGEGFLMSALNPKAIIFFAALFPLFIDISLPFIHQVALLAITFLVLDGLSLLSYAFLAVYLSKYLQNTKKMSIQNKIIGLLLILGAVLLSFVKA